MVVLTTTTTLPRTLTWICNWHFWHHLRRDGGPPLTANLIHIMSVECLCFYSFPICISSWPSILLRVQSIVVVSLSLDLWFCSLRCLSPLSERFSSTTVTNALAPFLHQTQLNATACANEKRIRIIMVENGLFFFLFSKYMGFSFSFLLIHLQH